MGLIVMAMVQWGFLTAIVASGNRRNAALWFGVGAALPVVGVGIALAAGRRAPRARKPERDSRRAAREQRQVANQGVARARTVATAVAR